MKTTHTHISEVKHIDIYEREKLYRQLGGRTPHGFYKYYFDDLPFHSTNFECFNHVNTIYFDLYGEYRYEDYNSFRRAYTYHLKNK